MIIIILSYTILILILSLLILLSCSSKEKWANTYSGYPGPIESSGRYNIPALYGRGSRYEATDLNYQFGKDPNSRYISLKHFPK